MSEIMRYDTIKAMEEDVELLVKRIGELIQSYNKTRVDVARLNDSNNEMAYLLRDMKKIVSKEAIQKIYTQLTKDINENINDINNRIGNNIEQQINIRTQNIITKLTHFQQKIEEFQKDKVSFGEFEKLSSSIANTNQDILGETFVVKETINALENKLSELTLLVDQKNTEVLDYVNSLDKPDMSLYLMKEDIPNILIDCVTRDEVISMIELPDLTDFVKREELPAPIDTSNFVNKEELVDFIKREELPNVSDFIKREELPAPIDTSNFVIKEDIVDFVKREEIPNVSNFVTKEDVINLITQQDIELPPLVQPSELTNYFTKDEVTNLIQNQNIDLPAIVTPDDLNQFVKKDEINNYIPKFITRNDVIDIVNQQEIELPAFVQPEELTKYAKRDELLSLVSRDELTQLLQEKREIPEVNNIQDLSNYVTRDEIQKQVTKDEMTYLLNNTLLTKIDFNKEREFLLDRFVHKDAAQNIFLSRAEFDAMRSILITKNDLDNLSRPDIVNIQKDYESLKHSISGLVNREHLNLIRIECDSLRQNQNIIENKVDKMQLLLDQVSKLTERVAELEEKNKNIPVFKSFEFQQGNFKFFKIGTCRFLISDGFKLEEAEQVFPLIDIENPDQLLNTIAGNGYTSTFDTNGVLTFKRTSPDPVNVKRFMLWY